MAQSRSKAWTLSDLADACEAVEVETVADRQASKTTDLLAEIGFDPIKFGEIGFDPIDHSGQKSIPANNSSEEKHDATSHSVMSAHEEKTSRVSHIEGRDKVTPKLPVFKISGEELIPKRTPMKPGRYDGSSPLESFLAQFDICARHNRWDPQQKVDFLRCSLDKSASQLLWDYGSRSDITYDELVARLRARFGTEDQAETYRIQLYYLRQRSDQTLNDLSQEVRRLVALAYPGPTNSTTEILARDAFLEIKNFLSR